MAEALIDSLSDEELDPGRYRDVHRETLHALIDAKATGRTVTEDARPAAASPDLLGALRASIEAAATPIDGNGGPRRAAASPGAAKKKQKSRRPHAKPTRRRRHDAESTWFRDTPT